MSLNEKVWKRTNEFDERVDPGALGSNDYGFFIENCTAERIELPNERKTILDRESISSPILRLIINGYFKNFYTQTSLAIPSMKS